MWAWRLTGFDMKKGSVLLTLGTGRTLGGPFPPGSARPRTSEHQNDREASRLG